MASSGALSRDGLLQFGVAIAHAGRASAAPAACTPAHTCPALPRLPCSEEHKQLERQLQESQEEAAAAAAQEQAKPEEPEHLVVAAAALREEVQEARAQASWGWVGLWASGHCLHCRVLAFRPAAAGPVEQRCAPHAAGQACRCYSSRPCAARTEMAPKART